MKVSIIGTGNAAHILGKKFLSAGHEIIEVIGRNEEKVKQLAETFFATACTNIKEINKGADLYLIAVTDTSISKVADNIQLGDKLIVHTAGSLSKDILSNCSTRYGVIYPLQSLKKELNNSPAIPVLVDGSDDHTINVLKQFSATWAASVQYAGDEERLKTHVAAVVVNNFTNHLFTLTKQFCDLERIDFSLLYPLIKETEHRIQTNEPSAVQTGPAVRNDFITIEKHLGVLASHHYLRELYKIISSNIIDFYRNKTAT